MLPLVLNPVSLKAGLAGRGDARARAVREEFVFRLRLEPRLIVHVLPATRSRSDEEQKREALESKRKYQARLSAAGKGEITTEILDAPVFYYAEEYHQQYLAKNPDGYCGIGGCGVPFKSAELPVGEKA